MTGRILAPTGVVVVVVGERETSPLVLHHNLVKKARLTRRGVRARLAPQLRGNKNKQADANGGGRPPPGVGQLGEPCTAPGPRTYVRKLGSRE